MEIPKEKAVAFTGYRTAKILSNRIDTNLLNVISTEVYLTISTLYRQGFRVFLTGMADGFDTIAAKAVLRLKKERQDVKLIAVIPFRGQEDNYSAKDKHTYHQLLKQADNCVCLAESYTDNDQYLRRNDFLLENSSQLVCYYDGKKGGTMYTYNRAEKAGKPIINIFSLLSSYFENSSPAKKALQRFSDIEGFDYSKEGLLLCDLIGEEPITVAFEQIINVENRCGKLHITLANNLKIEASLFSEDCKIYFPDLKQRNNSELN